MRNRGRRRFHSAQDSSLPRPNGPGPNPRRDQRGPHRAPAKPQGEIIFGVEPVRELLAASPNAIQTLYVKNGLYERFGGEIETVREAGGKVVRAEDGELARMAGSEGRHQGIVASIREYAYVPLEELLEQQTDPLLIVDGVTDPRNLGA
ncbi:MAG TPA: RNA methyltransferase substrate-binding domain-containing protein, partial [Candidatus Binataceae bacterium]|nr:RNA methyltransferase substrate-binding domain-containing protein [Candidatus Binataceae bacterium]